MTADVEERLEKIIGTDFVGWVKDDDGKMCFYVARAMRETYKIAFDFVMRERK